MAEFAGYLPGLSADEVDWQVLNFDRGNEHVEIAVPVLSETQLGELAARVKQASRAHLKSLTVSQITDIIDKAIARLLDRNDPYRQKAERLLPLITGYDAEMVRLGLTHYLKTFRRAELQKFLAEDFTNPGILDDFQPVPKGGFAKASGPDLLVHIWAGNVPGLPLWSLISGLLVKAGTIGKVPSAEPLFAGWFAELLVEIEPKLADCLAVVWWKGGDEARESALLKQADVVLAYGGNDSLAAIRARTPITTRCLTYGHKVSFGMVSRAALDTGKAWSVAHQAAYDVIRYDQQGCYSPHVFFVERGGKVSPREFSKYVANELACFEQKFPRRALPIEEAGGVAAWRHAEETKSSSQGGRDIMGDAASAWGVVYVEEAEDLAPSGLNRTIKIVAIDDLADTAPRIAPFKAFLQTVGIAAAPEELFRLAASLSDVGVTRICALGHMTAPEAGWHHDGRFNLLDLVTLTEIERSAENAADDFAPYVD
ncbi:MAG: acyl-CoA reductase [Proteobacteria bacterium]|nr:acyl-CoA reductase [Pseudomonadota bacterium]MDA1324858.1 acyl-CoA reductase [Pseudomonadota bacterium]